MSDTTSLDHVESTGLDNLSNQNDELVNYLDAYLYSSFFGADSGESHLPMFMNLFE